MGWYLVQAGAGVPVVGFDNLYSNTEGLIGVK
jgi:hypothetical protein